MINTKYFLKKILGFATTRISKCLTKSRCLQRALTWNHIQKIYKLQLYTMFTRNWEVFCSWENFGFTTDKWEDCFLFWMIHFLCEEGQSLTSVNKDFNSIRPIPHFNNPWLRLIFLEWKWITILYEHIHNYIYYENL